VLHIEEGRERQVISAPMDTADQTAKAGCCASTTIFMWLYWRDTSPLARHPPVQSDQLFYIGADMTSATSLSLSIYNLLLYGVIYLLFNSGNRLRPVEGCKDDEYCYQFPIFN